MQTKGCQTEKQHSTCRRTQPERSVAKWRQCDDTWSVVYQSVVIHVSKKQLKNIEKFQILSDNGPILTLASSARWLAQTVRFNFRGRGRAPSPSPFSKINLRRFFQSTPDLGNEPIELAQILHAAPIWWYKNKSLVVFCRQISFWWPKTHFLGRKLAIFWLF